jgi:hypothetical protein
MARKVRILLSPGYHAEAGETKGHQHDVYTTAGELHGYQRIHVGTLMKSAVNAWANTSHAVNLHDEMVEALKTLIDVLPADMDQPQLQALVQAEKLLARAEGRPAFAFFTPTQEGE